VSTTFCEGFVSWQSESLVENSGRARQQAVNNN
jgi:hypothetical protein